MRTNIYFLVFVWLMVASCGRQAPIQQTEAEPEKKTHADWKKHFLEQASIFGDMSKLKKTIKEIQLTDREVMEFCRQNDDIALRAKMIGAIFSEKEYNDKPAKEGFWAAYRFNLAKFVENVSIIREGQETFMDIGSGNGEKLYGALCLGFKKAYGLEYSETSFKTSKQHLKNFQEEIEITQGDALAIDGSYFQKADFLYMYSPIKDDKMMASLFKRAMENMKEGATLLEVRCVYAEELNKQMPYNFPQLRSWLAIKKKDGKYFYKNLVENSYSYDKIDGRAWIELKRK